MLDTEHSFRYFWKSAVAKTEADIVIMSHDIPEDTNLGGSSKDRVSFAAVDPKEMTNLMRDRHLAYWKYLTMKASRYNYVMLSEFVHIIYTMAKVD